MGRLEEKLSNLKIRRDILVEYLTMKCQERDWHGVQDSASDLRDVESEIKAIEEIQDLLLKIPDSAV